jgi:hypothetical protein
MTHESKVQYEVFLHHLRKAEDALSRAKDGATLHNWDHLTFGYTMNQLCRSNGAIIKMIEIANAELNGRSEGEPDKIPEELEPPQSA